MAHRLCQLQLKKTLVYMFLPSYLGIITLKSSSVKLTKCWACTNECDQKTLIILYKSLVRSQLECASQVWSPFTKEKITALERAQRRVTKFILKTDLCYPERLVNLKLLPLEYRREILDLSFFFKCLKGYGDFSFVICKF